MGTKRRMSRRKRRREPVDATSMPEWEADTASQAGTWFLFWFWYVPMEALRVRKRVRAIGAAVARGRALLRYPIYTAPIRGVAARVPTRR